MTSEEARKHESLDVAIVGGGAAGVGLGAVLADLGLDSYAILERGEVGAAFQQWPEEMRLITPSFPATASATATSTPSPLIPRPHLRSTVNTRPAESTPNLSKGSSSFTTYPSEPV